MVSPQFFGSKRTTVFWKQTRNRASTSKSTCCRHTSCNFAPTRSSKTHFPSELEFISGFRLRFVNFEFNSRSWTEAIHSGNRKIQNLLKCPIFNGEHHDMIEIWKSQLIAEILSILYFNKNFMTDLSSKIVQQLSMTQHIRNYLWIRLNP